LQFVLAGKLILELSPFITVNTSKMPAASVSAEEIQSAFSEVQVPLDQSVVQICKFYGDSRVYC
jgi:hypothetical protein